MARGSRSWLDGLRPVTVPGGGAGTWDIGVMLVQRQLRLRAARTFFGLVWPVAAPVVLLGLYVFVFQSVFKVPIRDYAVFLFSGLLPWTFLAQTLGSAVTSLSGEADRVRNAAFPYELLPISTVLAMSCFFFVTLVVFVVYLAARGLLAYHLLPMLVVPFFAVLALVAAISMVLALIDVYNRDLRQVLANLLTVWFFLIPIVYRTTMVPKPVRFLRSVDPMNMIVGQFRDVLYFGHLSEPSHAVITVAVCAAVFLVSLAVFRGYAPRLAKDV
jgi:ABC-type polysaccharide/polyol phosphate export permease